MKSKKIVLSVFLLLAASIGVFAQETLNWYVCTGSFGVERNALNFKAQMEKAGYSVFIEPATTKDGKKVYRVCLSEAFVKPDDARAQKDKFAKSDFSVQKRLSGFWICNAPNYEKAKNAPPAQNPAPAPKPAPKPVEEVKPVEPEPAPAPAPVEETPPAPEEKPAEPIPEPTPEPEPEPAPKPVPRENEVPEAVLEQNENMPVSPDRPYSVLVQSYKEESAAQNDKERLSENNVNAHIIRKFNEDDNFTFALQAGAATTPDGLDSVKKQLEDLKIKNEGVNNYNDYAEEVKNYDEIVKNENVVFDGGINAFPKKLPENVLTCLRQFPINKNFMIEKIAVFDFDGVTKFYENTDEIKKQVFDEGNPQEIPDGTSAFSVASYKDELLDKKVDILIAVSNEPSFDIPVRDLMEAEERIEFQIEAGVLKSVVLKTENGYRLKGVTDDTKILIQLDMYDFSNDELKDFVSNIKSDSSLLVYPQIRKTLCVMPEETERDFLYYTLNKVDKSYAVERSNSDWAKKFVGHWRSGFRLVENNNELSIGIFDLDYDYNAKKIHEMFMKAKADEGVSSEKNHSTKVKYTDGWYLEDARENELSFSEKSYIIAVDSENSSSLRLDELNKAAEELKIW